jgi:hypothetical protein
MLGQRFLDLNPSQRAELAQADLVVWKENLVFGVGPGLSQAGHQRYLGKAIATHTEYTRLLAEHGMAGLLAILLMVIMLGGAYRRTAGRLEQYWVIALLAWPMMEMTHAAMRIVAISFLFGLAMVNWVQPEQTVDAPTVVKR